jgi:hypothetical protein
MYGTGILSSLSLPYRPPESLFMGRISRGHPAVPVPVKSIFGTEHPLLRFTISPHLADKLASLHAYYTLQSKQKLLLVLKNISADGEGVSVPVNCPFGFVTRASREEVMGMHQYKQQMERRNKAQHHSQGQR